MDESEARAVARVISTADGGIYAVPALVRLITNLLPDWDWEQLVADVDPSVAGHADLDRLRNHRDPLLELARTSGIKDVRWDPQGRRLVAVYGSVDLADRLAFEEAAAELVGRAVPIVSDRVASTRDDRGYEPF